VERQLHVDEHVAPPAVALQLDVSPSSSISFVTSSPSPHRSQPQHWLGHVGSPASTIERLDVEDERSLDKLDYSSMDRRPNVH